MKKGSFWHGAPDFQTGHFNLQSTLYFKGKNGKQEGPFLYDLSIDKGEKKDIATSHPEITARLKSVYDRFWKDARPHMIHEVPEEKEQGKKSEFHEMYREVMGDEKYKAALAGRDGLRKYFFRSNEPKE